MIFAKIYLNIFISKKDKTDNIPYDKMFPDDKYWLPLILEGKKIRAYFEFDKDWNLLQKNIYDLNKYY